jgi:hypothetical protein
VGVRVKEGVKRLVTVSSPPKGFVVKGHPTGKTAMRVAVKRVGPPAPGAMWVGPEVNGAVRVRGIYEKDGTGRFAYSVDGGAFQALPGKVVLRFADWKGARVGLFSFGAEGGAADFSGFRYRYFSAKADLEGAVK